MDDRSGPDDTGLSRLAKEGSLSEDEIEAFKVFCQPERVLPAGEAIHHRLSKGRVHFLCSGWTATVVPSPQGVDRLTAIHLPGDLVDTHVDALIDPPDRSVAITDATVRTMKSCEIGILFKEQPRVALAFFHILQKDRARKLEWISLASVNNAEARFATLLIRLGQRIESIAEGTAEEYHLPLTKAQIANIVGVTPAYISRLIARFEDRGWLEFKGSICCVRNRVEMAYEIGVQSWDCEGLSRNSTHFG